MQMHDSCNCAKCAQAHIQRTLPGVMHEYKMIMNQSKTEYETLSKEEQNNIKIKFLGTKLNVKDEIEIRKSKARMVMRVLRNVWKFHHIIRESLRIRMYKACVGPHLMYNTATIPAKATEMEALDQEHRKGLRIALGIFYPMRISNITLYE